MKSFLIFTGLFGLITVVAFFSSLFLLGPNIVAIANVILPFLVGIPVGYGVYFSQKKKKKVRKYGFPLGIYACLFILCLSYSLWERRPQNLFRVFIAHPIPQGVTYIKGYDMTAGFDYDIILHFSSTPKAIETIITINELERRYDTQDTDKLPLGFFENIRNTDEWILYSTHKDIEYVKWLWVNPPQTEALYT